jgi:hypothetical protein
VKVVISVREDFSFCPSGRYREQSPDSGQRFREDFLVPALETSDKVVVDLDGVLGYGSSWLQAAFQDLIEVDGYPPEYLRSKIQVVGGMESDRMRIKQCLRGSDE